MLSFCFSKRKFSVPHRSRFTVSLSLKSKVQTIYLSLPPKKKNTEDQRKIAKERKKERKKDMGGGAMKIVFGLLTLVTVGMIIGTQFQFFSFIILHYLLIYIYIMILIVYNFHAMFHFLFFTVLLQKIWFIHFPSLSNIPICLTLFIIIFFLIIQ